MRNAIAIAVVLVAASLAAAAPSTAQDSSKPNILVIFGDDIGMWNVGAYTHGMMGRTPNIDSIAKDGMLFTDHYGQPSCTAGRAAFIMGQMPIRTGMTTIGIPGLDARHPEGGPDARRSAEVAGLRHRPVRQEPPRRPQRVPADRARLRRMVRQPLPPQRRGRAGGARLSRARRTPTTPKKFGPRGVLHAWATDVDDPTDRSEVRPGRQAEDREHRPADPQAHGDLRRRGARPDARLARPKRQGRQAVLLLVQHDRDPHLVASAAEVRPDGGRRGPRRGRRRTAPR